MGTSLSPTFILGVGAQKTGTTWLDAQLRQLPFCDFGFKKEYHVWDVKFSNICQEFRQVGLRGEHPQRSLIRLMQKMDGIYEQYFAQLISDQVRVVGDITPSYSCLDAPAFAHIKQVLESVGFSVKVIFFMRDPVMRNWSSLRMYQREMNKRGRFIPDKKLISYFESYYSADRQFYRTNYPRTLESLYQVFDPRDIFIEVYENLFNQHTLNNLTDFLGFDVTHFNISERVNDSPALVLPDEQFKLCKNFYQSVYDYCSTHFSQTHSLWSVNDVGNIRA